MLGRLEKYFAFSMGQRVIIPAAVAVVLALLQPTPSATAVAGLGAVFAYYFMLSIWHQSFLSRPTHFSNMGCVAVVAACSWVFSLLQYPPIKIVFLNFDSVVASILLWILVLFIVAYNHSWDEENPNEKKIRRLVISGLLVFVGLLWIRLAYDVGFEKLYLHADKAPERLRDITFKIWDTHSFREHWGLTFLSLDDFANKKAYTGHATPYLLLLYAFNSLTQLSPGLSIRQVAVLEMLVLVCAIVMVAQTELAQLLKNRRGALLAFLGIGFCVTSPLYWISAGKANVDNVFFLHAGMLVMLSYMAANPAWGSGKLWYPIIALCSLIFPMGSVLLGVGWILLYMQDIEKKRDKHLLSGGIWLIALSLTVWGYLQLAAKANGFVTTASTWLYRSGLDGDTYLFLNLVQAVITPAYPRPIGNLILPMIVIMLLFAVLYFNSKAAPVLLPNNERGVSKTIFLGSVSTLYLGTLVLWPQSLSAHPYLYDFMGLLPIYLGVILILNHQVISRKTWFVWVLILVMAVQANLTAIAQAGKCPDCFPDQPTKCGITIQFPHYQKAGTC